MKRIRCLETLAIAVTALATITAAQTADKKTLTLKEAEAVIGAAKAEAQKLNVPEHPHNFAWGDDDGKTLYMCAKTGLYRIRLNVLGIRP